MNLSTGLFSIFLLFLFCGNHITTPVKANILHDIKEIIKDIFAGSDDGGDKKEIERVRKTMAEWKSCLGVQLDKAKLDDISHDCDEEFDITDEKEAKKKQRVQQSSCYRVCQLEHLGWLHDTDSEHTSGPYFNHTAVELFVNATFPASVQVSLKKKISGCARAMDSFSDEKACKNYKVFFKCLDKAIHDKCKTKGGSKKITTMATTEEPKADEEDGEETTSTPEEE